MQFSILSSIYKLYESNRSKKIINEINCSNYMISLELPPKEIWEGSLLDKLSSVFDLDKIIRDVNKASLSWNIFSYIINRDKSYEQVIDLVIDAINSRNITSDTTLIDVFTKDKFLNNTPWHNYLAIEHSIIAILKIRSLYYNMLLLEIYNPELTRVYSETFTYLDSMLLNLCDKVTIYDFKIKKFSDPFVQLVTNDVKPLAIRLVNVIDNRIIKQPTRTESYNKMKLVLNMMTGDNFLRIFGVKLTKMNIGNLCREIHYLKYTVNSLTQFVIMIGVWTDICKVIFNYLNTIIDDMATFYYLSLSCLHYKEINEKSKILVSRLGCKKNIIFLLEVLIRVLDIV